jgi:chaperonin cofactor prefoldin
MHIKVERAVMSPEATESLAERCDRMQWELTVLRREMREQASLIEALRANARERQEVIQVISRMRRDVH